MKTINAQIQGTCKRQAHDMKETTQMHIIIKFLKPVIKGIS